MGMMLHGYVRVDAVQAAQLERSEWVAARLRLTVRYYQFLVLKEHWNGDIHKCN